MRQPHLAAISGIALLLFVALLGCRSANEEAASLQRWGGETMGTTYRVVVLAPADAVDTLTKQIDQELIEVNQQMSTYIADSEISKFNRWEGTAEDRFSVSEDTAEVVGKALEISDWTSGAFDVTVGPLVRIWGFGPDGLPEDIPTQGQIDAALERVGFQNVVYHGQSELGKARADVEVDLSAIAKGHGVDRIAELLEHAGLNTYFVEIGGEVRTSGIKPDGEPWRLGIERPSIGERGIFTVLELENAAVATSGSYRNLFEVDGVRYSHTIDPRTGQPVQDAIVSATVIAESCAVADGLATSMMCLGFEAGLKLANERSWAVLLIAGQADAPEVATSQKFDELFPSWQMPAN